MLLTCEKCQTIFRVEDSAIAPAGQHVRCSVCAHVWHIVPPQATASEAGSSLREGIMRLRKIGLAFLIVAIISTILFAFRAPITASFPGLIPVFQMVGISIQPDVTVLEVRALTAVYQGNVLRVRGQLATKESLPAHATMLEIRVSSDSGEVLAVERIFPESDIITSESPSPFFVQIEVENAETARVDVVPISAGLITNSEAISSSRH